MSLCKNKNRSKFIFGSCHQAKCVHIELWFPFHLTLVWGKVPHVSIYVQFSQNTAAQWNSTFYFLKKTHVHTNLNCWMSMNDYLLKTGIIYHTLMKLELKSLTSKHHADIHELWRGQIFILPTVSIGLPTCSNISITMGTNWCPPPLLNQGGTQYGISCPLYCSTKLACMSITLDFIPQKE